MTHGGMRSEPRATTPPARALLHPPPLRSLRLEERSSSAASHLPTEAKRIVCRRYHALRPCYITATAPVGIRGTRPREIDSEIAGWHNPAVDRRPAQAAMCVVHSAYSRATNAHDIELLKRTPFLPPRYESVTPNCTGPRRQASGQGVGTATCT